MTKHSVSLGSISSGSMRSEDLYESFTAELAYLDSERAKMK